MTISVTAVASGTATVLTCPACGSHDLTEPHWNGYVTDATECRDCDARMGTGAATPGTDAHVFIWNSRNEAFRTAGYSAVSVNEHGRYCIGGREPIPSGSVAWEDSDGWLWCRMHVDSLLRNLPA